MKLNDLWQKAEFWKVLLTQTSGEVPKRRKKKSLNLSRDFL